MNYFMNKLEQSKERIAQRETQGALAEVGTGGFSEVAEATGTGESLAAQRGDVAAPFQEQRQAFGQTQQGDDPNRQVMRGDYGWKMTDEQYGQLQKDTKAFEGAIDTFESDYNKEVEAGRKSEAAQIAKAQADYQKQHGKYQQQYANWEKEYIKARQKLGNKPPTREKMFQTWFNKERMPVRVVSGNSVQATYWMPKSMVRELDRNMRAKGMSSGYVDKGRNYNVEVRQHGRIMGKEMHNMMKQASNRNVMQNNFFKNPQVKAQYNKVWKDWNRANAQLKSYQANMRTAQARDQTALSNYKSNIRSAKDDLSHQVKVAGIKRDTEVGKVRNQRQGKIDAARSEYELRTSRRRQAYRNMANMGIRRPTKQGEQNAQQNATGAGGPAGTAPGTS